MALVALNLYYNEWKSKLLSNVTKALARTFLYLLFTVPISLLHGTIIGDTSEINFHS